MSDVTSKQYKVYITPRKSGSEYDDEIQVSAEIIYNGIKTMRKSIDSSDYEIGVYTYGDITIKLVNKNGKYNDELDNRSIFKYSRDLAKVRIVYSDNEGEITRFRGLINEEATKQDFDKEEVVFRVLSRDSVIRTTKVAGGLIANGVSASDAIKSILNQANITKVLNYSEANINVGQDFTIDVGSEFDNQEARSALNDLLVASSSVLLIDDSDNMIVQSREKSSKNLLSLYGPYDQKNRQNIHGIKKYNTGKHRVFTSVKIGDTEESDSGFVADYGFKQLNKNFPFITSGDTRAIVAEAILNEFKNPRVELEVTVPTKEVKNLDLLDPVSLNYPLRVKRYSEDKFLPVVGVAKINDSQTPLPRTYGNASISPAMGFKVIEIAEKPKSFETILKLRQFGWFTDPASSLVGFAVIGTSVIGGTGDDSDKWNPAFVGGGQIGKTKIS